MHSFINDSERNRMITTDYHSITLAPKKLSDPLDQTRTGVSSDPLTVHCQIGIPFQNT